MDALSPSIVLAASAEPFLEGRRAVVFGDSTTPLAEELLERGARLVHVFDPVPARAAEAAGRNRSRQISIVPLDDADVAVRNGAFDVALVPDLSSAGEPASLLARMKRALGPRGVALVASPNPDAKTALVPDVGASTRKKALGYYELYDAVSAEFAEVKMLGQTPFVGYAVVDFAPESEPDVAIDSDLVPGGAEEPEWFIAIGAAEPLEILPISIVQLPSTAVVGGGKETKLAEDLRAARAAETHLIERVAGLEVELGEQKKKAEKAEARPKESPERLAKLQEELSRSQARIEELEAKAAADATRADEAGAELDALRAKVDAAREEEGRKKSAASQELEALRKKVEAGRELEAREAALRSENERLSKQLAEQQAALEKVTQVAAEGGPDELAALESALKERGERIRKLEVELREAERVGKQLVAELRKRPASPAPPAAEATGPGPLAMENARLRADLEAAGWTIQELEGRLHG